MLDVTLELVPPSAWAILTICQEAAGESDDGKLAVAEVIRDRTLLRYQSDGTVAGTVLKPYQFSGWNTRDPARLMSARLSIASPVFGACARAWARACAEKTTLAKGAVLYHAAHIEAPAWASASGIRLVTTIGAHLFYTDASAER